MAANPSVATDVGGTFTDLLVFETDGDTGEAQVRSAKTDTPHPQGYEIGVFDVMAKAGVAADSVDFLAHGTTGSHQRADRAHRRQGRPHHDAGVSRHAGDRARQPAGLLQSALSKARALRAAQPAPRAAGPHRLSRAGDAPHRSLAACRRSSRFRAEAWRRSRSALSTPTRTPRTSRRRSPSWRGSGRMSPPSHPTRSRASGVNTSAPALPCSRPMCSRWRSATSSASTSASPSAASAAALYIMQSNWGVAFRRHRLAHPHHDG